MLTKISVFSRPLRFVAGIALMLGYSVLTLAESNDNELEPFLLTDESIVFVYDSLTQEKTSDTVFAYAISQDFRHAREEFTRYDIVQALQPEIKERLRRADEAKTFGVIVRGRLNEYDFERQLFPIYLRGSRDDEPRYVWFHQDYGAKLSNVLGKIELPVPFESAKKLAGELQYSREVECVVVGRITSAKESENIRRPPRKIVSIEAEHIKVRFTSGREVGTLDLSIPSS